MPDVRTPAWAAVMALLIPAPYRAEVLADLLDEREALGRAGYSPAFRTAWLGAHIVRSSVAGWRGLRGSPSGATARRTGHGFLQDVRYGMRQLVRQRSFALVAVLTVALGIGASTAIFTVIDAAMLRPLPYPSPEQLVRLGVVVEEPITGRPRRTGPSWADMELWRTQRDVFSTVAGAYTIPFGRVVEGPRPERLETIEITPEYLPMHDVAPIVGRGIGPADLEPHAPDVVLLGYGYWQRHYGGDAGVIGDVVRFRAAAATIVGVLPHGFQADIPLWRPLRVAPEQFNRRGAGGAEVYARLRPGLTIEEAARRLSERMPPESGRTGQALSVEVDVQSRVESAIGTSRTTVYIIAGAVAMILLLACVNVAGLLLARGASRQSELAVRASLGASRGRIVRQLVTESVVLSFAGGALGVGAAWLSLDALVANLPLSLPAESSVTLNWSVMGAALLLTMTTGMAFGLIPAFRLSRGELNQALASGSRRQGQGLSRRGGQWLIATEVAFAVVLVVGAGLMIRSFARIMNVDVGFDPASIVTMQVQPISAEDGAQARFYPELLRAIRAIPGVEAAGAVDDFALSRVTTFTTGRAEGRRAGTESRQTTPGYLEALGIEPVEGRLPTEADAAAGREIIVLSETLAHDLFPDGLALGRQVQVGRRTLEVVGVVPDLRHGGPLRRPVSADAFLPFANRASGNERGAGLRRSLGLTVVVRPRGEVPDLAGRLRQAAQSIGPPVLVEGIRSGTDWLSDRVVTPRRRTVMLGLLGALGLVLALVGIFGMTAYAVSRRTREIGVRMAFGARPGQVVGTMVRDALTPLVVGTLVGLAGAAAATRVIANFLFETEATDPATFATVAVLLTCAGLLAAWVPALRAARVDPVTTLRAE